MAEEQKAPETQAGTQPGGQQPAQEAQQPAAQSAQDAPKQEPEKKSAKEHKEHKEHKAGREDVHARLAAAQQKAEDLSGQLAQAKDTLMRTAAEYDNFRKRSAREKDAAFGDGVAFAVEKLLGVLDTLSLAANTPTQDENYKKGVIDVYKRQARRGGALSKRRTGGGRQHPAYQPQAAGAEIFQL